MVKVLASGAMRAALPELIPEFERATGHGLAISYHSSNTILSRIREGETADMVIVTAAGIDALVREGRAVAGSRTDIASSGLGIAVRAGMPRPDIGSVDAFKRALRDAKSIAYTASGASGVYFAGLIERLGIAEQIKARAKVMSGSTGAAIVRGEAELAVQQIPELMEVSGADIVGPFPAEVQSTTLFSAGIMTGAKQPAAARELIGFLASPAAARALKSKGMEPAAGE